MLLRAQQVHIWQAELNVTESAISQLAHYLTKDELVKANRLVSKLLQHRYIAAHGFMRDVLSRYLCCKPNEIEFNYGAHGKPYLSHSSLQLNLSHSDSQALLAITLSQPVGIDIEKINKTRDLLAIAKRYFSTNEFNQLQYLEQDQMVESFYTCWTRKEAYMKATGVGLSMGLDTFEVSIDQNNCDQIDQFLVMNIAAADDYCAALAVAITNPEMKKFIYITS